MEFAFLYLWPDSHTCDLASDHPYQSGTRTAVPDYFAAGDFRVFFSLGAYFAGALEIIVYAGAIMVLFVFVVMMLNLGGSEIEQERQWLKPQVWIGPAILSAIMLVVIVYAILGVNDQGIDGTPISAKAVGITLFGPYVLAVELASMLLLAGLVVAFHVGREERAGEVLSNRKDDSAKRKTEEHA
ncbi:NADH-quinone oxidoreductase chain J [Escherichia coli]|uniref:NADH-quinone oxidoreductase subunit J n=1 Tax=Escherichia coli TaxID=562 RepID=A0A376KUB7_ECOLX|nr:NADH-quinone oxidoreductase chain J [Escherichia coli]